MEVYVVMYEHPTGRGVMNVYKNKQDAEEAAADYDKAGDENHNVIYFYVDSYTLQ